MKKGWEVKKLGEVCEIIKRGIAPKYLSEGGFRVINQKCVRNHEINYELCRRHNNKIKTVNPERIIKLGDVLVNSTGTGTLGRVAQVRKNPSESTTIDTHVTIVRPIQGLFEMDFFGYMLIFIEEEIKNSGVGASGQTELARKTLSEKFEVTYPLSHKKQQRIVKILDKTFENIETAKGNVTRNLENAQELFNSSLTKTFKSLDLLSELKELGDVFKFINGRSFKKSEWEESGLPIIRIQNLNNKNKPFNYFNGEYNKVIEVNKGDLLFSWSGTVGSSFGPHIWGRGKGVLNQHIFNVISTIDINQSYVFYFFKHITSEIEKNVNGSVGLVHITKAKLNKFEIPIADKHVQKKIVKKLDVIFEKTNDLKDMYKQKIKSLEELKQSILQKAYKGELT
jgi:type I restriction enzyme, S subunit